MFDNRHPIYSAAGGLYWHKHPDGSMTRKLVEDWTDEERALDLRFKEFLKEAEALGFVVRVNTDTAHLIVMYEEARDV